MNLLARELWAIFPPPPRDEAGSLYSPWRGGVTRFCFGEFDFVTVLRLGEPKDSSPYFKNSGVPSSSATIFADSRSLWRLLPEMSRGDCCGIDGVGGVE
jgi:hypothetical protein